MCTTGVVKEVKEVVEVEAPQDTTMVEEVDMEEVLMGDGVAEMVAVEVATVEVEGVEVEMVEVDVRKNKMLENY